MAVAHTDDIFLRLANTVIGRRGLLRGLASGACGMLLRGFSSPLLAAEVEWLKEIQQPPEVTPEQVPKLPPILRPEGRPAVNSLGDWKRERQNLRAEWLKFLGPMPTERPPVTLEILEEDHPQGVLRQRVRYEGEPGIFVEGYLLLPDADVPGADAEGRRAGLVGLHPTTNDTISEIAGVRGDPRHHLGLKLAQRGFVVFCPLCFLWHEAKDIRDAVAQFAARRPQTRGMHKMLYDAQRGVDVLESLNKSVDPGRIGAFGHSLGAKETLYLAAFDERVRAGVFSEGGIGYPSTNWHDPWYLGTAIREPGFALQHHQLLALIAPRAFLLLGGETGPGAADGDRSWPYIEAALPAYELYPPPARIGLLNHHEGHSVSPRSLERLTEWLLTYLL